MNVSQWNLTREDSPVSGLHRYDNEIYKECSKLLNVNRFRATGNKLKSFLGFKSGDVTHITTQQLAFLKVFKNIKNCVVTVHDLTPHHWFNLKRQIDEKWFLNEWFLDKVDMFITDSDYSKRDLINCFGIDEARIQTVFLGVDHETFKPLDRETCREALGMDHDAVYLLAVSSGEPWKNTSILEKLPFNVLDIGYGRGKLGTVNDTTLAMLYNACDIFLTPSKAEGFCLPVVESMACGCPVIASNMTALPEVVGCGGVLVNPDDPAEWISEIDTVLGARESYSKRAIRQASKFSWEKCGQETVKVYKEMV